MKVKAINRSFYNLLGLCKKAGKIIDGETVSEKVIRSGQAHLVILSEEASLNTKVKFRRLCENRGIHIIIIGKKEELGWAIGKLYRTILVVTNEQFKNMLLDALQREESKFGGEC
jgi:ribosomal protein L7Ae-like RNA K-turn-binding protein